MAYMMMTMMMGSGGNSDSSNNNKQGISEAQQQHAGGGGGGGGDGGVGKKKSGGGNSEKKKRTTNKMFNTRKSYIVLLLLFLPCCTITISFILHPEQGEHQQQGTTKLEDYSFEPPPALQANQDQNNNHINNNIDDRYKSKSKYTQESREQKQTISDNNNEVEAEEAEEAEAEANDTTEDEDEVGGKEDEEEEEIKLMYHLWNHTTSTIDIPNELRPPFSFVGGSPDTDSTTATFKLTSLEILQSVLHGEENENEYLAVEEYIQTNYSLPTTTNTIPQCLIPNKVATRELANEFVLQNKKPSLPVLNVGMPKMGTTTLVSYIDTHIFRG
jgi:membrane-associated HD superfamily phosphohydrolase